MTRPADQALRRLLLRVLIGYLVFVVYGSLVPLHFQPMPWLQAWAQFQQAPFLLLGMASRADLVANLLLFVPLAFLMRQLMPTRGPAAALLRDIGIAVLCLALAITIEFVQVFFPGRTVSLNDPLAEGAGAVLGLVLHAVWGATLLGWLRGWWLGEIGQPLAVRVLHSYLVLLLISALMPLDLTISPVEVLHKLREGRVFLVPLSDLPQDPVQMLYGLGTDLVLWVPVGVMWGLLGRSPREALLRGLCAAALIELLQVFVFSRVTSSTDVLLGAFGCWAGGVLVHRAGWRVAATRDGHGTPPVASAEQALVDSGVWVGLFAAWAVLVLLVFWFPYTFSTDPVALGLRWQAAWRVPFETYYQTSEFHALNELLRKMLFFLPGGLLWAGHVSRVSPWRRTLVRRIGLALVMAVAVLVESGQLFMPEKVADLTDLLLEALGGWIGLAVGYRLWMRRAAGGRSEKQVAAAPFPLRRTLAPETVNAKGVATRSWPKWVQDAVVLGCVAITLWVGARLPGVPYNVKELVPTGAAGVATALALAAVAWWLLALPQALQLRWRHQTAQAMWLVPALPLLGLLPGVLLVVFAPEESLADVVGSPVLGWPFKLETLGRFMALYSGLALAAIGAVWLVARLSANRRQDLLGKWLVATVLWALPLHAVVVSWAATDNLTELMRSGGNLGTSLLLFLGLLAMFCAASAVAALLAGAGNRHRLLMLTALGWPVAAAALWWGSEPLLFKYDKVFSAAQFMLSANRGDYATGPQLWARFAALALAFTVLTVAIQATRWRQINRDSAGHRSRN